jgi:hypothetical protein
VTLIENAGKETEECPSLTLMVMFESVPTSDEAGVPLSRPVAESKLDHDGAFWTEKVSESPSASDAVGTKEYADPAWTLVAGVPEMVGAEFEGEPDDVPDPDVLVEEEPELPADGVGVAAEALEPEPPQPDRTPTPMPAPRTSSTIVPEICFIK